MANCVKNDSLVARAEGAQWEARILPADSCHALLLTPTQSRGVDSGPSAGFDPVGVLEMSNSELKKVQEYLSTQASPRLRREGDSEAAARRVLES
jgi:hypothetical protein